jgi:hypothetical protein
LFPSELVSRLGSIRKMNLTTSVVVPCVFDAIFAEFDGIPPVEENIRESFKDLKESHDFFVICYNL